MLNKEQFLAIYKINENELEELNIDWHDLDIMILINIDKAMKLKQS